MFQILKNLKHILASIILITALKSICTCAFELNIKILGVLLKCGVDGGGWGDLIGFRDWCRLDIEKTDNLKKTPSNYPRRS